MGVDGQWPHSKLQALKSAVHRQSSVIETIDTSDKILILDIAYIFAPLTSAANEAIGFTLGNGPQSKLAGGVGERLLPLPPLLFNGTDCPCVRVLDPELLLPPWGGEYPAPIGGDDGVS